MAITGIEIQCIAKFFTEVKSTNLIANILIPIMIEIREDATATLLNMPETTYRGNVLKVKSAVIAKHDIGGQGGVIGISRGQVHAEMSVIVNLTKNGTHR